MKLQTAGLPSVKGSLLAPPYTARNFLFKFSMPVFPPFFLQCWETDETDERPPLQHFPLTPMLLPMDEMYLQSLRCCLSDEPEVYSIKENYMLYYEARLLVNTGNIKGNRWSLQNTALSLCSISSDISFGDLWLLLKLPALASNTAQVSFWVNANLETGHFRYSKSNENSFWRMLVTLKFVKG